MHRDAKNKAAKNKTRLPFLETISIGIGRILSLRRNILIIIEGTFAYNERNIFACFACVYARLCRGKKKVPMVKQILMIDICNDDDCILCWEMLIQQCQGESSFSLIRMLANLIVVWMCTVKNLIYLKMEMGQR